MKTILWIVIVFTIFTVMSCITNVSPYEYMIVYLVVDVIDGQVKDWHERKK